ncbi:uncharacterized protein LOC124668435 [Lolium rigidum]|uniref:uncharacterized protein LOC124668435 n=1 Tax=Lolium rigidum TaxID=89674 RepID=UPI001F5DB645|nr:uncharacterized protein LOC124668435 [Lolium rigidum]
MGDPTPPAWMAVAARKWLEDAGAIGKDAAGGDVCAAAIMSVEGIIKVSVHYDISYFVPAKHHDEVEMDGRVVDRKGRMTAVTIEVRKKETGELVAIGRQWMTTSRPKGSQGSKL